VTRLLSQLWCAASGGMIAWYKAKMFVEHASAITSDAMHVLAGVLIQILVALLSRRAVSNWLPWLAVLGFSLLNEFIDLWIEQWPDLAVQYGESAKDILLTMALPTLLLIVSRIRPELLSGGGRRSPGGKARRS
jgi:hypothetical protein